MELAEVVRRRRMVRRYLPDPVDPEVLRRVLEVARRAPSAGFTQASTFIVATDATVRRAVADACGEAAHVAAGRPPWLSAAPVHVALCTSSAAYEQRYAQDDKAASRGRRGWDVPWWWVDAGAALMALLLAAVDEGLGAGVLAVERDAVADLLGVREDEDVVALVTLGHPVAVEPVVGSAAERSRRAFDEQVRSAPPT